jgi:hypothetical protein
MNSINPDSEFKYQVFISYSHEDEKLAKWIQAKLEGFKIPRKIITTVKAEGRAISERIYPVFRDRTELSSGAGLPVAIKPSLFLTIPS